MPNFRHHLFGGLFIYAIVFLIMVTFFGHHISLQRSIEWLACVILGSLLPDVDTGSKGRRVWFRLALVSVCILILAHAWLLTCALAMAMCIPLLVRHRGILHSLWFYLVTYIVIAILSFCWCPRYAHLIVVDLLFLLLGVISHLWLDRGLVRMLRFK